VYVKKNREGFDATSDMKAVINQVYNADIEAIRNLSSIATQLTISGGLVVPGSLKIASKLATNNLDPNNMPDGWGGGLRIFDGYASGTMGFGPDGKALKAYINSSGNALVSGTLASGALNNSGNATIGGTLNVGGITNVSALYTGGGTNNNPGGKDAPWGTHFPWKGDGNNYIRGDTILNGNLVVSGTITIGTAGDEYTLMPGGDGFRIASGGANDSQRWWFRRNPGKRNVF